MLACSYYGLTKFQGNTIHSVKSLDFDLTFESQKVLLRVVCSQCDPSRDVYGNAIRECGRL